VDDSVSICKILEKVFSNEPGLHVVGYALDPFQARDMIKDLNPDVLTLDVEMPKMDGLTFLKNLMRLRPMPVVMLSSLTSAGAQVTLDALEAGAVDFMHKVQPGSKAELDLYMQDLVARVKQASKSQMKPLCKKKVNIEDLPDLTDCRRKLRTGRKASLDVQRLVAIGASTGGPEALRHLLTDFDSTQCALVIAQHMPEAFMEPFAERLNKESPFKIAIAKDNEQIRPGYGYMAPGDEHLTIVKRGDALTCKLLNSGPVCGHRPSVDVLFNSVAEVVSSGSIGVLMTGMGDDGAEGLTKMRKNGSLTIVQDEKSSAVWGMPGRAYKLGGADGVFSLQQIAPALSTLLKQI
jgi:two-component system chemotaxis response regulator CheB